MTKPRQEHASLRAGHETIKVFVRITLLVSLILAGQVFCAGMTASTGAAQEQGTLVQTIDTWLYSPPSPDPAGVTYLSNAGTLLVSDSEVNEMSIFEGVNLFEIDTDGTLLNMSPM